MIPIPNLTSMFVAKSSVALNLVLIGILTLTFVGKNAEIRRLKDRIDNPETGYVAKLAERNHTLGVCRATRQHLQSVIDDQNRSIQTMAEVAREQAERGTKALADVRLQHKPLDVKITQVGAAKAGQDNCKSADTLILETVK